ncbi:MAG: ABC transporter ATP-binding protein [Methanomassiliicoccales archaeon]|nr:ABC transporter ATP-binding protein [Methanomassiliicoccales archaeon]
MKHLIETVGLTRNFGSITAVEDLNLVVKDGEVFGFIGPNGAGKTTTVRMLCCLIAPTAGTAYINGLDITSPDDAIKIRGMIGLLPESPGLYESLSAYRNLDFFAQLYGVPKREREQRIRDLLTKLDVWDRRDDPIAKFSKGMKQKIAIARALVHEPEFLFLDEPTSGLDPQAAITVRNYLLELKKEGRTIFLNTHNLDDAQRICDRVGIIQRRILAVGSAEDLARKFWGRTTLIKLKKVTPEMIAAVSALPFVRSVRENENTIAVDVENPENDNPLIVRSLINVGAEVEFVEELRRGLEEIYLRLVGGYAEAR